MEKIKSLISPIHIGFVFELFMENSIHPYYNNQISNTLTNKKVQITTSNYTTTNIQNLLLVTDIPSYLGVELINRNDKIKLKKITQYKGFLIDLTNYQDTNSYLIDQISKRSRKNLKAKQKKLEANYQITHNFYFGDISRAHYDFLFDVFYELSAKRFAEKKMYNKNLIKWKYYHELVFPMILDKKASISVIYDNNKPIAITLNFHLNDMVFSFIETYDIEYSRYNMGDISMFKHLEWCINNKVALFDMSMGETGQKIKWCNHVYDFEYHIFYNSKSVRSWILSYLISLKLNIKQFLRNKNIIGKLFQYDKFFYKQRIKKLKNYNWKD